MLGPDKEKWLARWLLGCNGGLVFLRKGYKVNGWYEVRPTDPGRRPQRRFFFAFGTSSSWATFTPDGSFLTAYMEMQIEQLSASAIVGSF